MDFVLAQRFYLLLWIFLGMISCTSQPDGRIPPERTVHFPFALALKEKTLLLATNSSDGKYDFGRLLSLNTTAIKSAIDAKNKTALKDFKTVVTSNLLIPGEVSEFSFSDKFIAFASRETNSVISLPVTAGTQKCNKPFEQAEACPNARSIKLSENDPFALASISEGASEEFIMASYLSSSRLELLKITANALKIEKNFDAAEWLRLGGDMPSSRRVITKKIFVTRKNDPAQARAHFLFEQHLNLVATLVKPRSSFLVSIKVSDLLGSAAITKSMIESISLGDNFSILGAQDVYIDESLNEAVILGRIPEALFRIDLSTKSVIATNVVCTGATSIAVNKDLDLIVVPCFKDNRLKSYSLSTLEPKGSSMVIGRGPVFAVIDQDNKLIYCSLNTDGTVVVLDLLLNDLGEIFNRAPSSRTGS